MCLGISKCCVNSINRCIWIFVFCYILLKNFLVIHFASTIVLKINNRMRCKWRLRRLSQRGRNRLTLISFPTCLLIESELSRFDLFIKFSLAYRLKIEFELGAGFWDPCRFYNLVVY
jgi:hypothetical protein